MIDAKFFKKLIANVKFQEGVDYNILYSEDGKSSVYFLHSEELIRKCLGEFDDKIDYKIEIIETDEEDFCLVHKSSAFEKNKKTGKLAQEPHYKFSGFTDVTKLENIEDFENIKNIEDFEKKEKKKKGPSEKFILSEIKEFSKDGKTEIKVEHYAAFEKRDEEGNLIDERRVNLDEPMYFPTEEEKEEMEKEKTAIKMTEISGNEIELRDRNDQNDLPEWSILEDKSWLPKGKGALYNNKREKIEFSRFNNKEEQKIYGETKRKVINKIVSKIDEWEIDEVVVSLGSFGRKKKSKVLVHNSFVIEYKENGELDLDASQHKFGKIHFESGFTSDEWKEIKQEMNFLAEEREHQTHIQVPLPKNFS